MAEITVQSEQSKAVQTTIHIYLPLFTPAVTRFRLKLLRAKDWHPVVLDTCFYLRYVDQIFCAKGKNQQSLLTVNCLVMQNDAVERTFLVQGHTVALTAARLYCFDTSVAILDFRMSLQSDDLGIVSDICSELRRTNLPLIQKSEEGETEKITLNLVAKDLLLPLGKHQLFDHLAANGQSRADMFTTIVADESIADQDLNIYRIARGFDTRQDHAILPEALFSQFSHLRWAISSNGVCNIGLLTGDTRNDDFVRNCLTSYSENRYIIWYMLVIHQKYALYHYLNEIANKDVLTGLRDYQKKIVRFNTKYRFEVVSEEATYQFPYQMLRDTKLVESVFSDIDEEIARINEYHNTISDKNNAIAMTIVSLVCTLSTFLDIFQWSPGGASLSELLGSLSNGQRILLVSVLAALGISLAVLLAPPARRLYSWLKEKVCRLFERIFLFR